MNSNPKIVVFHLKELIYTIVFIVFGILLIGLLIFMFSKKDSASSTKATSSQYKAGVYTSAITLNGTSMDLQVTVDKNNINAIEIKNSDEAITTMYPMMVSSVDDIANQIIAKQSLDNISYADDCKYTYSALIDSIRSTLDKAKKSPD